MSKQGLRQGAVSQKFLFGFRKLDENGKILAKEGEGDPNDYVIPVAIKGSVIGPLSMIVNSKLTGRAGGGYVYSIGRIAKDQPLTVKAFVVLKGDQRDKTKLSVGKVTPKGSVKASLGEPTGRGSMVLYPLEIELIPGKESIERLGKNKDDYGMVWIESDNPKVSKMLVALKFAIEGR